MIRQNLTCHWRERLIWTQVVNNQGQVSIPCDGSIMIRAFVRLPLNRLLDKRITENKDLASYVSTRFKKKSLVTGWGVGSCQLGEGNKLWNIFPGSHETNMKYLFRIENVVRRIVEEEGECRFQTELIYNKKFHTRPSQILYKFSTACSTNESPYRKLISKM